MSSANDYQRGGNHYRRGSTQDFQHWDFIEMYGFGYLEGYASKYVMRWRVRGLPVLDLEKSIHIMKKLQELHRNAGRVNRCTTMPPVHTVNHFLDVNDVKNEKDRIAFKRIIAWQNDVSLEVAILGLLDLLEEAKAMETGKRHVDNTGQKHPFGYQDEEGR